jgi:hypothetical protein
MDMSDNATQEKQELSPWWRQAVILVSGGSRSDRAGDLDL